MILDGTKLRPPSSSPSKISAARALLASKALAAKATVAMPAASFSEALMENLGVAETRLTVTFEVVADPADLRPVNEGMATAEEDIVAIFVLLEEEDKKGGRSLGYRFIMCGSKALKAKFGSIR